MQKLSAILITKNEEKNIHRCLSSLDFVDEVIMVDSGSTDQTISIAKQFQNVRIISEKWYGFVKNKNIAINQTQHDWIFWIDADEEVTSDLKEEWDEFAHSKRVSEYAGISIPRKSFFLSHFVKHSGWYPNPIVRFFNKKKAHLKQVELHEGISLDHEERMFRFRSDLLHYSYQNLNQYFYKMNFYGESGAKEVMRRKKKVKFISLIYQPAWTFIRFYFLKKGYLDGKIGFIVCVGSAYSNFIKYCHAYFMSQSDS